MNSQEKKNQFLQKRMNLKEKLRGTLSSWKVQEKPASDLSDQKIGDRTPVIGQTQFTFDDAFQLGKKIGEGASGTVYTCISKKDKQTYAVKVSRGDQEMIRIVKKTFKHLQELNHPSIIKVRYLFLDEVKEKIHLVMEYFKANSLAQICDQLNVEEKKNIIRKILEAIKYIHKKGICHRDIKLQNILYDRKTQQLKLIDFGISKKLKKKNCLMENMWTITGTLQYMAPQVLIGYDYNETVDCWALGILCYYLFYKRFPFQSQFKSDMIKLITQEEPIYLESERLLNGFLKRLLRKQPKYRSSASDALKHPWIEIDERTKRLNSDDLQLDGFSKLYRSNTIFQQSPNMQAKTKEDMISSLKQISIFESKRIYKNILANSN